MFTVGLDGTPSWLMCSGTIKYLCKYFCALFFLMRNNQQVHVKICSFITYSEASYMLGLTIMAIFSEVIFGGILHRTLK